MDSTYSKLTVAVMLVRSRGGRATSGARVDPTGTLKGNQAVIDALNEPLKHGLGAIKQYWLHYRMLDNRGYTKLAAKERKETIEETHHADRLVDRILFLEGHRNLQQVAPLMIGQNLK